MGRFVPLIELVVVIPVLDVARRVRIDIKRLVQYISTQPPQPRVTCQAGVTLERPHTAERDDGDKGEVDYDPAANSRWAEPFTVRQGIRVVAFVDFRSFVWSLLLRDLLLVGHLVEELSVRKVKKRLKTVPINQINQ